jgi:bZIP transcription factor
MATAASMNMDPEEEQLESDRSEDKKDNNHEISSDDGSDDKKADKSSGTKRPVPAAELDDDKKAERRAANRRSAFQSRQRRKILIDDLQRTVAALSKDNGDLRRVQDETRVQLEAALLENHKLRMQQQLTGMGAVANPAAALFSSVQALQQAQAQAALLRGGNPAALAQLLAAGGPSVSAATTTATTTVGVPGPAASVQTEELQDKQDQPSSSSNTIQQQEGAATPTPQPGQGTGGVQGILNAASAANGQVVNAAALLQFLQNNPALRNSPLSSLSNDAGQLAGLKGLLEQLSGNSSASAATAGAAQSTGNVSDALRAILQSKNKQ